GPGAAPGRQAGVRHLRTQPGASRAPGRLPRRTGPPVTGGGGPDLVYLWARLGATELRVRQAVADRQAADRMPDDPYGGLYLTVEGVQRILAAPWRPLAPQPSPPPEDIDLDVLAALVPGPGPRLLSLARRFGLDPLDVEFLLVALAPDV